MGEYAEAARRFYMKRGSYCPRGSGSSKQNLITATCPICGKGTRRLAGDDEGGLRSHMKDKHKWIYVHIRG